MRFRLKTLYIDFSDAQWAANSAVRGRIWPNFELTRTLMVVLITCKYEDNPIKNKGATIVKGFSNQVPDIRCACAYGCIYKWNPYTNMKPISFN